MENTNESVLFEPDRQAVERIRESFRYDNRAAIVHATGTGKTGIFNHLEPDQIIRLPEKYRNSKPMQTNDRIILGESSSIPTPDSLGCEVNIQKTFLSLSMLKEDQKEGAEDAELVRAMNELYKAQHNLPVNPF